MSQMTFRAMGCQMLAVIDGDDDAAARRLNRVPGWFAVWERHLSRFRDDSELMVINRASGTPIHISAIMQQAIGVAIAAARASDGLVTPLLLDAVVAAGYDRSWSALAADRDAPALPRVHTHTADWRQIRLDPATRMLTLPPGAHIDLGGSAKGWAASEAARRLGRVAAALVDAGGDIAVSGPMADGQPWPIEIADPRDDRRSLGLLLLDRGGVATSGRDYRRWNLGGLAQHHIIDPRTGLPAATDVLTATVVAPTCSAAEVAAKAALILGSHAGLRWIEQRPELAAVLVLENGRVIRSGRMARYLAAQN